MATLSKRDPAPFRQACRELTRVLNPIPTTDGGRNLTLEQQLEAISNWWQRGGSSLTTAPAGEPHPPPPASAQWLKWVLQGCRCLTPENASTEALNQFMRILQRVLQAGLIPLNKWRFNLGPPITFLLEVLPKTTAAVTAPHSAGPPGWTDLCGPQLLALQTLSILLKDHGPHCANYHPKLLQTLRVLSTRPDAPSTQVALETAVHLCVKLGTKHSATLVDARLLFLTHLDRCLGSTSTSASSSGGRPVSSNLNQRNYRSVSAALRGVKTIILEDKKTFSADLPHLGRLLRSIIFAPIGNGLGPTYTTYTLPSSRRPSATSAGPMAYSAAISGSDSDLTDQYVSDAPGPPHRVTRRAAVTVQTLNVLGVLCRTYPSYIQNDWDTYLPDAPVDDYRRPNLFTLCRTQAHPDIQRAILFCLQQMLAGARVLLNQSDDRTVTVSYTPRSVRIAQMVGEVQRRLLAWLSAETQLDRLELILRGLHPLANLTPYDRIRQPLVPELATALLPYLAHPQPPVAELAHQLWAVLLGRRCQSDRLLALLDPTPETLENESGQFDERPPSPQRPPRPLNNIVSAVGDPRLSLEARCGAAQLLTAVAQLDTPWLLARWPRLIIEIEHQFDQAPVPLQIHLLKCLESIVAQPGVTTGPDWCRYVDTFVLRHINSEEPGLRVALYDFLAGLSPAGAQALRPPQYTSIAHLTLTGTQHAHSDIQGAAYRALGFFCSLDVFREDTGFLANCLQQVQRGVTANSNSSGGGGSHASDRTGNPPPPWFGIRIPSAFGQNGTSCEFITANVSDALVWAHRCQTEDIAPYVTPETLRRLTELAGNLVQDDERIKISGLRILGNLFQLVDSDWFGRYGSLVNPIMHNVVKLITGGSFKVQWNACHAVSRMMTSPDFPAGAPYCTWTTDLFNALVAALRQSKNHKVRINACQALGHPYRLAQYGENPIGSHSAALSSIVTDLAQVFNTNVVEMLSTLVDESQAIPDTAPEAVVRSPKGRSEPEGPPTGTVSELGYMMTHADRRAVTSAWKDAQKYPRTLVSTMLETCSHIAALLKESPQFNHLVKQWDGIWTTEKYLKNMDIIDS
ncbi:armadillo-type protein [Dimargaris cristalligena]|uniref:Armadillo-type protein n=1 Tax=Dimargaris cristalligena TaxID=215637 RepID=A0A4P9ZU79_9FUNG|nr:armadillo-type protein [Dimargaris cristalligena]|eukprot:RKP37095.1 armadillo-type protein [Dimargaris cristalligena]